MQARKLYTELRALRQQTEKDRASKLEQGRALGELRRRCKELETERDRLETAVGDLIVQLGNARTELAVFSVPVLPWWKRVWRWVWRRS
jgi:hypothetical protein